MTRSRREQKWIEDLRSPSTIGATWALAFGLIALSSDRAPAEALKGVCTCTCSTENVEQGPIWKDLRSWQAMTRQACTAKSGLYCWVDEPHPSNVSHIGKYRECRWSLPFQRPPGVPPAAVKPKQLKPSGVVPPPN